MTIKLPAKYGNVRTLAERGKNADVWLATNTNLNREVFLKAYPISATDLESALREPKLLQELSHQNLVKIFDADDVGGNLLLEMELIDGGSLQALLKQSTGTGRWLPVHDVLDLVRDVASGVAYMHSKNLIHRDLKPANVMVRVLGSKRECVVTDLGLATRLTGPGRIFPSKHALLYRPPEVWSGNGYSRACDTYQIGVILFQMLGGQINYDLGKLPEADVGQAILAGELMQWRGFGPHIGRTLRAIIEKCVGPESGRFSDVADLTLALHNCKKKQANWSYIVDPGGFVLEQAVRGGLDHIDVRIARDGSQTIERSRRVNTPGFRREGKPLRIKHPDLARCQEFRRVLAKRRP